MKNKIIVLVIGVMLVVVSYFCFQYLAETRYLEAEGIIVDVNTTTNNIVVKTSRGYGYNEKYYEITVDDAEQYILNEKVTVVFDFGVTETSKDDKIIKVYK